MKAITKEEVSVSIAGREFPDFIIQAFNECILEAKIKHSITVFQDDVMERAVKLCNGEYTRAQIFDNHWFDVEEYFRAAGWKVTYYKPPYYDSSPAYFTFS